MCVGAASVSFTVPLLSELTSVFVSSLQFYVLLVFFALYVSFASGCINIVRMLRLILYSQCTGLKFSIWSNVEEFSFR